MKKKPIVVSSEIVATICPYIFLLLFLFLMASCLNPQIRKLRRELDASQEKVSALTTQLSANVRNQHATKHTTHLSTYDSGYTSGGQNAARGPISPKSETTTNPEA